MRSDVKRKLDFLKKYGLIESVKAFYNYKLENCFVKLINIFTKNMPLKNIIIIESHDDFDCNGGAFYSYLLERNYNKKYKIVWLLKNAVPNDLPKNVEGYMMYKPNLKKAYYRCVAKIYTADDIVTPKVRSDQKEYYLTHGGITFKNVKGILVVPNHVDYILSSSSSYDPYVCDNYSIPYPNNKMLHFGYPSNDCFFKDIPNEFEKINKGKYDKIILWMPTFRKSIYSERNDSIVDQSLGIPLIEDIGTYHKLNEYLKEHNSFLIIKIHPMQDLSVLKISDTSNIKVVKKHTMKKLDLDNSRLMKCADAFISDYSSAAYQYLLLDRPLAFVLSDIKEYKLGFSTDNIEKFLPGEHIYSFEEFISFIDNVIHGKDEYRQQRLELLKFLYKYQDGDSCKRLVKFMKL